MSLTSKGRAQSDGLPPDGTSVPRHTGRPSAIDLLLDRCRRRYSDGAREVRVGALPDDGSPAPAPQRRDRVIPAVLRAATYYKRHPERGHLKQIRSVWSGAPTKQQSRVAELSQSSL